MSHLISKSNKALLALCTCTALSATAQPTLMIQPNESKSIMSFNSSYTMADLYWNNDQYAPISDHINLTSLSYGLESRLSEYFGFSGGIGFGYVLDDLKSGDLIKVSLAYYYQVNANMLFYTPGLPELKWYLGPNVIRQALLSYSEYDATYGSLYGAGYQVGLAYQIHPSFEIKAGFEHDFYSDAPMKMRTKNITTSLSFYL
jgi:hypothetical protein